MNARANKQVRGTKPEWATGDLRLDPYALPQRVSYQRCGSRLPVTESKSAMEFTLDRKGAVVKCALKCGVPLSMALPSRAFLGVAARAYENDDGSHTITLELLHQDSELSVPLCVSTAVEDAADDWQTWAKQLGLPMLMVDEQGRSSEVRSHAGISSLARTDRRKKFTTAKWRPRFLHRRKAGQIGPVVKINAREIIART